MGSHREWAGTVGNTHSVAVIIPFRDRGRDPLRPANLERVTAHWEASPWDYLVIDDGRTGYDSFNRSAAYNRGAAHTTADILVYAESDLLVDYRQIQEGIAQAAAAPGLVVPFSRFMAITPEDSEKVRAFQIEPHAAKSGQVRGDKKSIGAVNIISRDTLDAIGQWPEEFEGAWFDDDACERAFHVCCGPTRFVDGPGWHLYHLSGAQGSHLTDADRAATEANKARYQKYLAAQTPARIRELTAGA